MRFDLERIHRLIISALRIEGSHHKQWYLEQIAEEVGIDLEKIDGIDEKGIAP